MLRDFEDFFSYEDSNQNFRKGPGLQSMSSETKERVELNHSTSIVLAICAAYNFLIILANIEPVS